MKRSIYVLLSLILISTATLACTNFLITKGATVDGSTMITYAADSHELYGELYYTPAADHLPGEMLDIYEWDTGQYLGQIRQILHTYAVVGNMNEHQLSIGETTFTGREELIDTAAIMDYGSLMYIALQRAKTAREAIKVIAELVEEYGYYSSGESFSIADPNEVWIMEIIGKGPGRTGAVWVARRIPDGWSGSPAGFPTDISAPMPTRRASANFPSMTRKIVFMKKTSSNWPGKRAGLTVKIKSSVLPTPMRRRIRHLCAAGLRRVAFL